MKWGVPMEGFYFNALGTWLLAMATGYLVLLLLIPVFHFPMIVLTNRNPNFFHELIMWFETRGKTIGGVLYAIGGRNPPSAV